uniref:Carbamoyl phosphate synthase small chain n=1 Tax=Schimmelmannia schousboei TaxID=173468 RepID=A0A1C9C8T9_9FLOR|nr:carbamoyl-phosphate synthase arginine-specific small subunit [Schimmelmannia schousboei]AOM64798.1 carbamoyl-phosphate synthase arginine-specific small subunit [Schimmelmannia schousboei]
MNKVLYPSILYLEDGTLYKGWSFIDNILSCGEVVFNTGMTGYQEIITDPSYSQQIIAFTYPELGNTGINNEDNESKTIHAKGIIAKNICLYPNNWRTNSSLKTYLLNNSIPHIFGIDTRALTKHLRTMGVMNACISSKILDKDLLHNTVSKASNIEGSNLVNAVTTKKAYAIKAANHQEFIYSHLNYKINNKLINLNVVLIDFGVKYNIISRLLSYGCNIYILPANSTYETIKSYKPDGILLSNGPGDPSVITYAITTVKQLIKYSNIPIFGICMGHQILSLALGAKTFKLKFGHRGLNHPSGAKKISEITSQNHGFAVNLQSLKHLNNNIEVTHFNLNDYTIAGILHTKKPIFSVQYHPEASPGPHDSDYLFKNFITLMQLKTNSNILK